MLSHLKMRFLNLSLIHHIYHICVCSFSFGNLRVYNMKVHLLLLLLAAVLPICRWHLPQGYYLYSLFPQGYSLYYFWGIFIFPQGCCLFTIGVFFISLQGYCLPFHRGILYIVYFHRVVVHVFHWGVVYLPQGYSFYYYRGIIYLSTGVCFILGVPPSTKSAIFFDGFDKKRVNVKFRQNKA